VFALPISKMAANKQRLSTAMLIQLRPKQWSKNILLFAALIFSIREASWETAGLSLSGFILFCLVSSTVYILNDYNDLEADRAHPTKRFRPMASGALNPVLALSFGAVLLLGSLALSLYINKLFACVLTLYFLLNVLYSLKLKHVVIIDVMTIAAGFVLRAIGGGVIIGVPLTPWFLICTMLLSLFLAIGKRWHEFKLAEENGVGHRRVLEQYNAQLLGQMSSIVTTATIMSYALFTFTSGRTIHLMWTIPFVLYGIFRYQYLIYVKEKGGSPDKLLFEDKPILLTVVLYAVSVVVILSYFE
jgi:4-hydroxybenzoate polyprenyltransferase